MNQAQTSLTDAMKSSKPIIYFLDEVRRVDPRDSKDIIDSFSSDLKSKILFNPKDKQAIANFFFIIFYYLKNAFFK